MSLSDSGVNCSSSVDDAGRTSGGASYPRARWLNNSSKICVSVSLCGRKTVFAATSVEAYGERAANGGRRRDGGRAAKAGGAAGGENGGGSINANIGNISMLSPAKI